MIKSMHKWTTNTRLRFTLVLLAAFAGSAAISKSQENAQTVPEITEHAKVKYPPLARQARIQGMVHMRVTTDGHGVTDVTVEDGHPLLTENAAQNVRTWKFVEHAPATFEVTFNYRVVDDQVKFLRQPGIVEVVESPEGGINSYTLPEKWNAQVRNAQGTIETSLTLWTYHDFEQELDGYSTGPQGRERPIHETHIDRDMLGFDATLEDKYGQRLKFSMIGKMAGNKINGVFLNYWGAGGTWSAERTTESIPGANSAPPASQVESPITAADIAYHEYVEYPRFAIDAGIEGTVKLRVSTNGHSATEIDAKQGNPFLVRAAVSNLHTWRFADHMPRTFNVIYSYRLLDSEVEFLKQPGMVEIDEVPPLVIIDNGYPYDPPEIWHAELKSSRGNMRADLSLGMSYDMPDGYVLGPAGKNEKIREGHHDGNMLGFDATVQGLDGRPIKVSVLGKKTRNKITGVFLDYSGVAGTWTALRERSRAKPAR